MKKTASFLSAALALCAASACAQIAPARFAGIRLSGPIGEKFDRLVKKHIAARDPLALTRPFHARTETHFWQTEFWGKYMLSACPAVEATGCAALREKVAASVRDLLALQEADGYLGNYKKGAQYAEHWDVWGQKYTIQGLLAWHRLTGDAAALEGAKKLGDYLIRQTAAHPLHAVGNYAGLPACSLLESAVLLYKQTNEQRYLDLAARIAREADHPDGPKLLRDGLAGIAVGDRGRIYPWPEGEKKNPTKAYEMMSCYQGFLEYYEVTGQKDYLTAAVKTAESIARDEINIVGGSAASEHWYFGALRQTLPYQHTQETCVTITWMRLCAKLLELTGEARWADELEKTFYNAYLAAFRPDGTAFAAYTPLSGCRAYGMEHCETFFNCCDANGPRGFFTFLETLVLAEKDVLRWNFYTAGDFRIPVPTLRKDAVFHVYTHYPVDANVIFEFQSPEAQKFDLALRIPAWSAATRVRVNGVEEKGVAAGGYFALARTWQPGDRVEVVFDLAVRTHECAGSCAFTRGPLALARDARLAGGLALDEPIANDPGATVAFPPKFAVVRPPNGDFLMTATTTLPLGLNRCNPDDCRWTTVTFCDYASAGNAWQPTDSMRVWFLRVIDPMSDPALVARPAKGR